MKVTGNDLLKMRADIKILVDYLTEGKGFKNPSITTMHDVWFNVYANRRYEDSHPMVIKIEGKRLLEQDKNFDLYPCDTNDNTIETALKAIFGSFED